MLLYSIFSNNKSKDRFKLTLKAKIKGVNLLGEGVSIAIRGDKKGVTPNPIFKTTQGVVAIKGNFNFTEFSVSLDSYPGNVDNIIAFLIYLPNTTVTAYFDDIFLTSN